MNEHYTEEEKLSTTFSLDNGKISLSGFDILRRAMAKTSKKKADDLSPLQKKMIETVDKNTAIGLHKAEIERRSEARRRPVDASTINSIINGTSPNVKTLEGIALAYDEDPVEWFKLTLDDPPDPDGFANSPIYRIWSLYQRIPDENLDAVNERIEDLIDYLRRKERP